MKTIAQLRTQANKRLHAAFSRAFEVMKFVPPGPDRGRVATTLYDLRDIAAAKGRISERWAASKRSVSR